MLRLAEYRELDFEPLMTEPAVTSELAQKHNLTPEEYEKIRAILGREPSYTELGIFSVMWSEHYAYVSHSRTAS